MSILALDIGTSHWKAGIISETGQMVALQLMPAPIFRDDTGGQCYLPAQAESALFSLILALPGDVLRSVTRIALTGMAEAGLVVDRTTGAYLSPIYPWFDKHGLAQFEERQNDPLFTDRYAITGLPNSSKYSIYKLLAVLEQHCAKPDSILWLGMIEYLAFLLTGEMATEQTLAARTYMYDINQKTWDIDFLRMLHLPQTVLPRLVQSGIPVGTMTRKAAETLGLENDIPICLCGHDHICAAYGMHAFGDGRMFSSMGTAQVLLADRENTRLSEIDIAGGLSYGPALENGRQTVLGSIQSSGSSVALANRLFFGSESFDDMLRETKQMGMEPSRLLYFPYLAGSGAPHLNRNARGGFLGLQPDTDRLEMVKSVYQGIAFELRLICEAFPNASADEMIVCGGLTSHEALLQIFSDVLGLVVRVPDVREAALLGAARLAFEAEGIQLPVPKGKDAYLPRKTVYGAYEDIYHSQYLPLQKMLLAHFRIKE